jgi:hypothetical protein
MSKLLIFLFLLFSGSQALAQTLIKNAVECRVGSLAVADIDGDRVKEKICLIETNRKFQNISSWDLRLVLSESKQVFVVGGVTKASCR